MSQFYITPHPSGQSRWWSDPPPTHLPSRLATPSEIEIIQQLREHNASHSEDLEQLRILGTKLQELFRAFQPSQEQEPQPPAPPFPTTQLYFESHITCKAIEPHSPKAALFTQLCRPFSFRPAKLWLQTRPGEPAQPSTLDTFATGRDQDYAKLILATRGLIHDLQSNGFSILRYKIENTLLDSRVDNPFGISLET